jgi:hypothetical protein
MEPLEHDELSQSELTGMLQEWEAPEAPARLRAAVFPHADAPWWRRLWHASIRVPLPVACALAALAGVLALRVPKPPAPTVVVRTERVQVPVERERIVTRYIYRQAPSHGLTFQELRPVAELRPRIIRRNDAQN